MTSPLYPDLCRHAERKVMERIFPSPASVSQCGRPLSPAELHTRITDRQSNGIIDPDER